MPKKRRKVKAGGSYQERADALRKLGFSSYKEYLSSDLWKRVRVRVYRKYGSLCLLCSNPATELHHLCYSVEDLAGRRLSHIKPICRECHQRCEFTTRGSKRTVEEARVLFCKKRGSANRAKCPSCRSRQPPLGETYCRRCRPCKEKIS